MWCSHDAGRLSRRRWATLMRAISAAGLTLVKKFEGVVDGDPTTVNLDPYLDPVGIWTIGWGHAIRDLSGHYLRGKATRAQARALYPDGLTVAQAETLLAADLLDAATDVQALVRIPTTLQQFSALVSFEFNTGGLRRSTLLKKLNAGYYQAAADEFGRWVKGRVRGQLVTLNGLVRRRADERALFLSEG